MRKIQMFSIAFVAIFACGALITASASAVLTFELALWLKNGADVTVEELVASEGELEFENVLNGSHFTCSGKFEGTVGPESADLVTMVYNLSDRLIEELAGEALLCAAGNCEKPEIWPVNLPWKTEVEQDVQDGTFWELSFSGGSGVPGYHFSCSLLGIKVEELCEAVNAAVEIKNLTEDVEAVGMVTPDPTCGTNAEEGLLIFLSGNLTLLIGGGSLQVSLP